MPTSPGLSLTRLSRGFYFPMTITVTQAVEINGQKYSYSARGEWDDWHGAGLCASETLRKKAKDEADRLVVERVKLLIEGLPLKASQ